MERGNILKENFMSQVAQKIDNFFTQVEWPFERLDEHLWRTAFPGDKQVHELFVSFDGEDWLSFRTFVAPAPRPECALTLYTHLLRLNSLIPLTKFCVMENGDVFGLIDLPTADLDYSEFRTALLSLVHHTDAYDNEILAICERPEHTSSLAAKGV
jgi:hypothetical protein